MVSRLVGEGRVDGMLVQVGDTSRLEDLQELVDADLPVVFINSVKAGHASSVVLDDERGAAMATQHLLDLAIATSACWAGCRTPGPPAADAQASRRPCGLLASRSWVTTLGYRPEQGRDTLRRVMSRPTAPTGIVVANVNAAIDALQEARRLGLDVPGDPVRGGRARRVDRGEHLATTHRGQDVDAPAGPGRRPGLYNRLHALPVEDHVVIDPAPELMLSGSTRRLA